MSVVVVVAGVLFVVSVVVVVAGVVVYCECSSCCSRCSCLL